MSRSIFPLQALLVLVMLSWGQTALCAGIGITTVVEPGIKQNFTHPEMVVLKNGFWAKSGSEVSVTTALELLQAKARERQEYPDHDGQPSERPPVSIGDCEKVICQSGSRATEPFKVIKIGDNVNLPNPPEYYAISKIEIFERNDNPCRLKLFGNMIDPRYSKYQAHRILADYTLDKCKSVNTWTGKWISVGFSPVKSQFVRALQTCIHHNQNVAPRLPGALFLGRIEIKGLKVRAAQTMLDKPRIKAIDHKDEDKLPHCHDKRSLDIDPHPIAGAGSRAGWHNWSTCPKDQLMTGVKVFYEKDKSFSAMTIICEEVNLLPGQAPDRDGEGY